MTVGFIDDHRDAYGVEPICTVVRIAPSTYHRHRVRRLDPTRRSARAQRDDSLQPEIQRGWDEQFQVYGPRKVWKQLRREGLHGGALHGAPVDAREGPGRRRPRARLGDDHAAGRRPATGRSRRSAVYGHATASAVGVGLHLRGDLGRVRLGRLRRRCVRAAHRRLAGVRLVAHRLRPRRVGTGDLRAQRRSAHGPCAPQR